MIDFNLLFMHTGISNILGSIKHNNHSLLLLFLFGLSLLFSLLLFRFFGLTSLFFCLLFWLDDFLIEELLLLDSIGEASHEEFLGSIDLALQVGSASYFWIILFEESIVSLHKKNMYLEYLSRLQFF